MSRSPFIFQGIEHWHTNDLLNTLQLIVDHDEAEDFRKEYSLVCGDFIAYENLGYFIFLVSTQNVEEGNRLAALFHLTPHDGSGRIHHTFGKSSLGIRNKEER